ncbi:MAG: hypothetical protein IIY75_08155 [Erysipelotrichales bacterium]|nr:hypothetical protein [Erysipelotrichales bacterium]
MLKFLINHTNYAVVLLGLFIGSVFLIKNRKQIGLSGKWTVLLMSVYFSIFSVLSALLLASLEEWIQFGFWHIGAVSTYGVYLICPLFILLLVKISRQDITAMAESLSRSSIKSETTP